MMRFLIVCVGTFFVTLAQSQSLSVEQYRMEVMEYSLVLKQAQNSTVSAEQSVTLAKVARLPQLYATGSYVQRFRHFEGTKDWTMAFEPQVVQTIYGGGVTKADIEQAELTHDVKVCDEAFTLLEVLYAADYAYWSLWVMVRHEAVMSQYVEIIRSQTNAIERRYMEGYTARGDLLMMSSRLSEAEYDLLSAEQSRLTAQHNLNILRGISPQDSVSLHGVKADREVNLRRRSVEEVMDSRPDYLASQLTEEVAAAATRAVKGAYNPQLKGGVGGSWRSYTPNSSGKTYLDGSLFVELTLPIYHFGERRKAAAVSRSAERSYAIVTSILRDEILKEESNAWVAIVESGAQMRAARRSLEIASENLEISTYSYNEGLVSIVDLLQAQLSWMQNYTNAIYSEYDYQLALALYRKVVGDMEQKM